MSEQTTISLKPSIKAGLDAVRMGTWNEFQEALCLLWQDTPYGKRYEYLMQAITRDSQSTPPVERGWQRRHSDDREKARADYCTDSRLAEHTRLCRA